MGWQDAPLVEEPKKGGAKAAWESAPLVDEEPAPAPPAAPTPPPREVGFWESAGRTAGASAIPVVRTLGLASATIAGILGEDVRDKVFRGVDATIQSMRDVYAPKEGEKFSTAGGLAGGVASTPIQVAGGFGAQHGVERASEVIERGGTTGEAAKAGAVSGAVNTALNFLPLKVGGAVGRALESRVGSILGGATTGAAVNTAAGIGGRMAENAALPEGEQYQSLQRDVLPTAAEVGVAATLGAVPGAAQAAKPFLPKLTSVSKLSDQKLALAGKAIDEGIPLNIHNVSESKITKLAGEYAEHIPLSGSKKEDRIDAFNNGLARALDPESKETRLTPETFSALQDAAGEKIGEIAGKTDVPIKSFGDINDIARKETPDVRGVVEAYAKDLQKVAEENGGVVPGDTLRRLRSEAGAQMRSTSNGDLRRTLGDLTKRLDDALSEHAAEGDMEALADARRRYAISKVLEPLVAKAPDGKISPALLMGAVTATKQGKRQMARGRAGDLGDYARIGQEFLREPGTSNTAERNLVYKVLTDGLEAAKIGATYPFALAYNKLGPRILEAMVKREQRRRGGETPSGGGAATTPTEPTLGQGFEPTARQTPPESPLGDLTPNWETAPGAAPERPAMETVSPEGLVPATGESTPALENPRIVNPTEARGTQTEIPAVPGRPDLPDVMVSGRPGETAANEATNAAMLSPETALARQQQRAVAEAPKEPVDPRLAKLDEEHGKAQSDAVRKVIAGQRKEVEKTIKAEQAEAKRVADIADLEKAAQATNDLGLKAAYQKQADALRTEKIPVGEAKEITEPPATGHAPEGKKLPVGKATEVAEEPATGRAPEMKPLPKGEATEVTRSGVEVQEKIPVGEAKELLPPKGGEHSDLNLPSIDEEFMRQEFNRKVEPKPNAPEPQVSDRGVQAVRKALEDARDAGHMDRDGASLAIWALDKNPGLAKGLKLSVESPHPDRLAKGSYNPAEEVVRIFKGFDNAHTATHEILHHSERMMPQQVQQGIQKEWRRALQEEMQKARGPVRELLSKIPAAAKGDKAAYEALIEGFKKGVLNREQHYQLVNPSEFWAVNAPRILSERFVGRGSWRAEAKQWVKEMIEHVKGTIGLRSDSPVLKALDEVLNPERNTGEKRSSKGLSPTPRSKP